MMNMDTNVAMKLAAAAVEKGYHEKKAQNTGAKRYCPAPGQFEHPGDIQLRQHKNKTRQRQIYPVLAEIGNGRRGLDERRQQEQQKP